MGTPTFFCKIHQWNYNFQTGAVETKSAKPCWFMHNQWLPKPHIMPLHSIHVIMAFKVCVCSLVCTWGIHDVKPARDVGVFFLFFYSSASFDHVNTSVRCTLEESCGQSAARPFIDLFTSIFLLALLKLFISDTLLYILQDPKELWLRPLWVYVWVCVCFNHTTQPLLHLCV